MGTCDYHFMKKYANRIAHVSIAKILEAFWYYCNQYQKSSYLDKCDEIMNSTN